MTDEMIVDKNRAAFRPANVDFAIKCGWPFFPVVVSVHPFASWTDMEGRQVSGAIIPVPSSNFTVHHADVREPVIIGVEVV